MQLWKAGIYALLFSLYYTLCTLVFGSLYSQSFINWGHEASAYYVELKIVNSFVSFSQVALTFFIACALSLFCASLLFLLLLWLPGGHILSWIVMLCFLCWDSFFPQYALFAERVSIEYSILGRKKRSVARIFSRNCFDNSFLRGGLRHLSKKGVLKVTLNKKSIIQHICHDLRIGLVGQWKKYAAAAVVFAVMSRRSFLSVPVGFDLRYFRDDIFYRIFWMTTFSISFAVCLKQSQGTRKWTINFFCGY